MKMSRLFKKILITLIILFAVTTLITSLLSVWELNKHLTREYKSKGMAIAESIASSSVEILLNRDASTVQAVVDQYIEIEGVSYVFVVDDAGEIISHTFVPQIPEEVLNLTKIKKKNTTIMDLEIGVSGKVIDISAPILAGVAGYVHVGMDKKIINSHIRSAIFRQLTVKFIVFLLVVFIGYMFGNMISQPLNKLTEYANELVNHDFTAPQDLHADIKRLPEKSKDELGKLAQSFLHLEASLRKYIKELVEVTAANEKAESELRIARDIQMEILPKIFPAFPHRSEFDIYATIEPARDVGGDFYDFFFIDDDLFCFVIGDVSGKGVPAALFMAVTKTLIKASSIKGLTPDKIMSKVNYDLSQNNESSMFVTIFFGVIDLKTGEVLYVNCGHNPPLFIRKEKEAFFLKLTGGMIVGAIEDAKFKLERILIEPGDTLFMYTEGVTEAMNKSEELFSDERLQNEIDNILDKPIVEKINIIMNKVKHFSQGAPQSDDITMLAIQYNGPSPS